MRSKLASIASVFYGKSPSEVIDPDGSFPILGTGGEYGRARYAMYDAGIVVPRKGSLGNPQLATSAFWATDTTFAVLPHKDIDIRWLYYCLLNYDLSRLNEATGVPSISRDWLAKIDFFTPSLPGQQKIARVLQTIDRTIEQTETLIDKYQQIKAGLMHDLFTRGIDPNGQLRPPREQAPHLYQQTPIGWIPKEWEVLHIADLCAQIADCPHSTPIYRDSGVPCIRTADMLPGKLLLDKAYCVDEHDYQKRIRRLKPREGDIIYSREGERLGIASPVGKEMVCLGQRVMILRAADHVDPSFLLWTMNHADFYRKVTRGLGATTSPHVNVGDIQRILVAVPSQIEQIKIGNQLKAIQVQLDYEERIKEKQARKKSGLMYDLLTGKIPVSPDPEPVHG